MGRARLGLGAVFGPGFVTGVCRGRFRAWHAAWGVHRRKCSAPSRHTCAAGRILLWLRRLPASPLLFFVHGCNRGAARRAAARYKAFRAAVIEASAQARVTAELACFQDDPKTWLTKGPGRETAETPGWSGVVRPVVALTDNRSVNLLTDPTSSALLTMLLAALAPYPDARRAAIDASEWGCCSCCSGDSGSSSSCRCSTGCIGVLARCCATAAMPRRQAPSTAGEAPTVIPSSRLVFAGSGLPCVSPASASPCRGLRPGPASESVPWPAARPPYARPSAGPARSAPVRSFSLLPRPARAASCRSRRIHAAGRPPAGRVVCGILPPREAPVRRPRDRGRPSGPPAPASSSFKAGGAAASNAALRFRAFGLSRPPPAPWRASCPPSCGGTRRLPRCSRSIVRVSRGRVGPPLPRHPSTRAAGGLHSNNRGERRQPGGKKTTTEQNQCKGKQLPAAAGAARAAAKAPARPASCVASLRLPSACGGALGRQALVALLAASGIPRPAQRRLLAPVSTLPPVRSQHFDSHDRAADMPLSPRPPALPSTSPARFRASCATAMQGGLRQPPCTPPASQEIHASRLVALPLAAIPFRGGTPTIAVAAVAPRQSAGRGGRRWLVVSGEDRRSTGPKRWTSAAATFPPGERRAVSTRHGVRREGGARPRPRLAGTRDGLPAPVGASKDPQYLPCLRAVPRVVVVQRQSLRRPGRGRASLFPLVPSLFSFLSLRIRLFFRFFC